MTHRLRRIQRNYDTILSHGDLSTYYQLNTFKVEFTQVKDDEFLLVIKYNQPIYVLPLNLPIELNQCVYSYLYMTLQFTIRLTFPADYPYKAPMFSLSEIKNQAFLKYNTIINNHSYMYKHGWTPLITIEMQLLDLISVLNTF